MKRTTAKTTANLRSLDKQTLVDSLLENVTGGLYLPGINAKCGNDSGVGPIGPKDGAFIPNLPDLPGGFGSF